ncbi:uncharacterized protein [Euphorbia lathyris]|uniref:uncharacterized protein n=1 Tax=Euphorbia lathyris TaxID=212925 RepID=UPI003314330B
MEPQQRSRIDLAELKARIVKKTGVERFKKYFYYLNRFLSQKLTKSDFDKSCFRLLGRENLPLHNQLIRSILKNACQAKTAPPVNDVCPTKPVVQLSKCSPAAREDGVEHSGSLLPNQNQNVSIWSNGVIPMFPRKVRSRIRGRKPRDRPSPLGPTGKVDSGSHQLIGAVECGSKVITDNGKMPPCDYERQVQHLQAVAVAVAEPSEYKRKRSAAAEWPSKRPRTQSKDQTVFVEGGEEAEQAKHLSFSSRPLLAPLGIPMCSASVGGEECGSKVITDNGKMPQCDYQRPVQHLQAVADPSEYEKGSSAAERPSKRPRTQSKDQIVFVEEDVEEEEQAQHLSFSSRPLLAPLRIPLCSASVGGARKAQPVATSSNFGSYYESGELSDSETLRKRMEQIAALQGIGGGVSMECANTLNNVLDIYLKRLIRSCVHLVGARSPHDPRKSQTNSGTAEVMHEQRPRRSISKLDFKAAMELNPQQLGGNWPLLLEKISMHAFED